DKTTLDNANVGVFRGMATTGEGEDFTTWYWDDINKEWVTSKQKISRLSDDDFYIGYAYETIEGVETRVEVIHEKTDKDVIITDSGNIVIATNGESKNFILTGEVNE